MGVTPFLQPPPCPQRFDAGPHFKARSSIRGRKLWLDRSTVRMQQDDGKLKLHLWRHTLNEICFNILLQVRNRFWPLPASFDQNYFVDNRFMSLGFEASDLISFVGVPFLDHSTFKPHNLLTLNSKLTPSGVFGSDTISKEAFGRRRSSYKQCTRH